MFSAKYPCGLYLHFKHLLTNQAASTYPYSLSITFQPRILYTYIHNIYLLLQPLIRYSCNLALSFCSQFTLAASTNTLATSVHNFNLYSYSCIYWCAYTLIQPLPTFCHLLLILQKLYKSLANIYSYTCSFYILTPV